MVDTFRVNVIDVDHSYFIVNRNSGITYKVNGGGGGE